MRLPTPPSSRREVLATAQRLLVASLLALQQPSGRLVPALAADAPGGSQAAELLALIPAMPFGAPATNATLPKGLVADIDARAASLERSFGGRNVIADQNLNGSWRLLYSDGREITSLAAGFPGGFALGPTYQPIDLATGRFENQGNVLNRYGLARLSTCVVGDVRPAPAGSLNAAGTVNDRGNRVDVIFRRITFSLDEVLGRPASVRKILVPNQQAGTAQPANDVTYLQADMRITRGGDGALFIFRREESDRPMLTPAEREELYSDAKGVDVQTGTGRAEDSAPPELKRLLQDR